jgi:hypothetical protein
MPEVAGRSVFLRTTADYPGRDRVRLVVRPTHAKVFKRGHRILRMSEAELGARLAERIDRIIARRQRQNVFVVAFCFREFSECEALLCERSAVGDVSTTSS